jgi:hypothetical protein
MSLCSCERLFFHVQVSHVSCVLVCIACSCACEQVFEHTCAAICFVCMHVHMCVNTYAYACVCEYTHLCVCTCCRMQCHISSEEDTGWSLSLVKMFLAHKTQCSWNKNKSRCPCPSWPSLILWPCICYPTWGHGWTALTPFSPVSQQSSPCWSPPLWGTFRSSLWCDSDWTHLTRKRSSSWSPGWVYRQWGHHKPQLDPRAATHGM